MLCALERFLKGHLGDQMLPDPLLYQGEPTQVCKGSDLLRLDNSSRSSGGPGVGS